MRVRVRVRVRVRMRVRVDLRQELPVGLLALLRRELGLDPRLGALRAGVVLDSPPRDSVPVANYGCSLWCRSGCSLWCIGFGHAASHLKTSCPARMLRVVKLVARRTGAPRVPRSS